MCAMKRMTPWERFAADSRVLQLPDNDAELRRRFVVRFERTMSNHHVVKIDGLQYEMPLGYSDRTVLVYHRLLEGSYAVVHDGKLVEIKPADLVANARGRRAGRLLKSSDDEAKSEGPLPPSAADLAFAKDFRPAVALDGGCPARDPDPEDER